MNNYHSLLLLLEEEEETYQNFHHIHANVHRIYPE